MGKHAKTRTKEYYKGIYQDYILVGSPNGPMMKDLIMKAKGDRTISAFAVVCGTCSDTFYRMCRGATKRGVSPDILKAIAEHAVKDSGVTYELLLLANGMMKATECSKAVKEFCKMTDSYMKEHMITGPAIDNYVVTGDPQRMKLKDLFMKAKGDRSVYRFAKDCKHGERPFYRMSHGASMKNESPCVLRSIAEHAASGSGVTYELLMEANGMTKVELLSKAQTAKELGEKCKILEFPTPEVDIRGTDSYDRFAENLAYLSRHMDDQFVQKLYRHARELFKNKDFCMIAEQYHIHGKSEEQFRWKIQTEYLMNGGKLQFPESRAETYKNDLLSVIKKLS